MPYAVVKVKGGFKVQNEDTGKFLSNMPLDKETARKQLIAVSISEGIFDKKKKKQYPLDELRLRLP